MVPREMSIACKHFRRQMVGLQVPRNVYVAVWRTDLIFGWKNGVCGAGRTIWRVPSGVSYMPTNRRVMKRIFPQLFPQLQRAANEQYTQLLLGTSAVAGARRGGRKRKIVLLSPGVSTRVLEHAYLWRGQMGMSWWRARDLGTESIVYMRTTVGRAGWM